MVSLDEPDRNREFAESLSTTQVLLSDLGGAVADRYGVTALGGLYARRWNFYISADGVIRYIDKDVNTETAGQDISARMTALGFPKREKSSQ